MELNVIEKEGFKKKDLLRLRETGSFKTKLPKRNNKSVGKMD